MNATYYFGSRYCMEKRLFIFMSIQVALSLKQLDCRYADPVFHVRK